MSVFGHEAWDHLDGVPEWPRERAVRLLEYLLGLACQSESGANIELGRRSLVRIRADWLHQILPDVARDVLDREDERQFERYVEVCCLLDASLGEAVVADGGRSPNARVREVARRWSGRCAEFARNHAESVRRPPL